MTKKNRNEKKFCVPPQVMFYCIFINKFSKNFKIWSFMSGNFFRKILQNFQKISLNFLNFSKIEKKLPFLQPN